MILDSDPSTAQSIPALIVCVATAVSSFLISVARYGLESVTQGKVERELPESDRTRFARYFQHRDRSIIAALLLMVLSDALFSVSLFSLIRRWFPFDLQLTALFTSGIIASIYLVLVGRVLARTLVSQNAESFVTRFFPILHGLGVLLAPLAGPLTAFRRSLNDSLSRLDPEEKDVAFTEEIRAAIQEGAREGIVEKDEAAIIENVVEFRDLDVRQVMTPRTDLDWVEATASVHDALKLASERGHARLPVGEGDSDHIAGIFYVRDVIDQLDSFDQLMHEPVSKVARKAHFVPETKHVVELLREFKSNKIQIAIVLDEFGGTSGLVTVEDILESLVGEIHDEHDPVDDVSPEIQMLSDDQAIIDGRARIESVNDALSLDLKSEEAVDTIGGLVFSTLGRVPHPGEVLHLEGIEIKVLAADDRRVKQVEVKVMVRPANRSS